MELMRLQASSVKFLEKLERNPEVNFTNKTGALTMNLKGSKPLIILNLSFSYFEKPF